jgi:hypothetical protein
MKITEEGKVKVGSLACSTLRVKGHVEAPKWGLGQAHFRYFHLKIFSMV